MTTDQRPIVNGYDYSAQAWIVDGRYVRCGHPDEMTCRCYGRAHEGQHAPADVLAALDGAD